MASTSTEYAARQNAVVPSRFSRPQLPLPQLLYAKYQRCVEMRVLGLAPALSSASISSMYVVVWNSAACGCGYRVRMRHSVLIVAYSGVAPWTLAMLGLAAYLSSIMAMSYWPLIVAISSGVVLSIGVMVLIGAPPSSSAFTASLLPCRTAWCSAVRPPIPPTELPKPGTPPLIVSTTSCAGPLAEAASSMVARPESMAAWICVGVNGPLGCGAGAGRAGAAGSGGGMIMPGAGVGAAAAVSFVCFSGSNETSTALRLRAAACSAAVISWMLIALVCAVGLAPPRSSTRTAAARSADAANINGVCAHSFSFALTSALAPTIAATDTESPAAAAKCSAEAPDVVSAVASLPAVMSADTTEPLPVLAATCNGVYSPMCVAAFTLALAESSTPTMAASPRSAAQCRAVMPSPCG